MPGTARVHGALAVFAGLVLTAGCGGNSSGASSRPTASGAGPLASDAGPPSANQRVLTTAQSERLVDWSVALSACLDQRGFELEQPDVMRSRIELAIAGSPPRAKLLRAVIRCGDGLGGPPPKSSLQTFASKIVIYVPKQCLLDAKVTRRTM